MRRHHLSERLLRRRTDRHVRGLRGGVRVLVRYRWRELCGLPDRAGVQRQRAVRMRRDVVSGRMLQRQRVCPVLVGVSLAVRYGGRGVRGLRHRAGVLRRYVHVRRCDVPWLLLRDDVRTAGERVERVLRRWRSRVRSVSVGAGVQQRGSVRLRCDVVSVRLLQRWAGRHVRALPVRVECLVRCSGRDLRGMCRRAGVQQHGAVRLRRYVVP